MKPVWWEYRDPWARVSWVLCLGVVFGSLCLLIWVIV